MSQTQVEKQIPTPEQLLTKCWEDEGFKKKMLSEPHAALAGEGIDIPEGLTFKVLENTESLMHVVLPFGSDEEFKKKLLADPKATIVAESLDEVMEFPAGVNVKVLENTESVIHLLILAKPTTTELSDEDLDAVAGGTINPFMEAGKVVASVAGIALPGVGIVSAMAMAAEASVTNKDQQEAISNLSKSCSM